MDNMSQIGRSIRDLKLDPRLSLLGSIYFNDGALWNFLQLVIYLSLKAYSLHVQNIICD